MLAFLPVILRFFYDYESEYVCKFQKPFNELQAASVHSVSMCGQERSINAERDTSSSANVMTYGHARIVSELQGTDALPSCEGNVFLMCLCVADGVDKNNNRLQNTSTFCKQLLFSATPSTTHKHVEKHWPRCL